VEFLVLAPLLILGTPLTATAQFPIRQLPPRLGVQAGQQPVSVPLNILPVQLSGSAAPAPPNQPPAPPHPAVARIVVHERDGVSYGSGTLVDVRGQFGLVVTNWHVIRDAAGPISVEFPDGFRSPAEVVKTDKDWDLAALSIQRPSASPVRVSPAAPQLGEWLTIAGYGSGQWRTAAGQCTQYLAPGVDFPHEMVELATEARQGDSGGPIFNQQGELVGVLFGSGPGYTSGSYGGRVLNFLATVVPGGTPGLVPQEQPPPVTAAPPPDIASMPGEAVPDLADPPHAISDEDFIALTPSSRSIDSSLLAPPARSDQEARFGPVSTEDDAPDPRVAVAPDGLTSRPTAITPLEETESTAIVLNATLPPRAKSPGPVDLQKAPSTQLLAALWKQVGGKTPADQAKTVLAIIGGLSLLVVFWRVGRQREPEVDEE
jgi:hypothetical protein